MDKPPVKILIVEDEAIAAMTLRMTLKNNGYHDCQVVATGEEAVSSAQTFFPDLVLMDVRLAGKLNGIEAARQIKGRADIPLIFMTGYSDEELMKQIVSLHPVDTLAKPIKYTKLLSTIDSLFRD